MFNVFGDLGSVFVHLLACMFESGGVFAPNPSAVACLDKLLCGVCVLTILMSQNRNL